ncbi:hypothetical protein ACWGH5_30845 [Streptomyces sp. NPDC054864]
MPTTDCRHRRSCTRPRADADNGPRTACGNTAPSGDDADRVGDSASGNAAPCTSPSAACAC